MNKITFATTAAAGLSAAIVGLGIAVLTSVSGGTTSLADKVSSSLSAMTIMTH